MEMFEDFDVNVMVVILGKVEQKILSKVKGDFTIGECD
jgi:hypothetical protein